MTERTEQEIMREIGALITEAISLRYEHEVPFVTSWALVCGVSTTELQSTGHERSEYLAPDEQSIFTTYGLFGVAARDFAGAVDD